jgi:hypothetical protein
LEQERNESNGAEPELAAENFDSSVDDVKARRFRRATSGFRVTPAHPAKALLLSVGVEVESHGDVSRIIGEPSGEINSLLLTALSNFFQKFSNCLIPGFMGLH